MFTFRYSDTGKPNTARNWKKLILNEAVLYDLSALKRTT